MDNTEVQPIENVSLIQKLQAAGNKNVNENAQSETVESDDSNSFDITKKSLDFRKGIDSRDGDEIEFDTGVSPGQMN